MITDETMPMPSLVNENVDPDRRRDRQTSESENEEPTTANCPHCKQEVGEVGMQCEVCYSWFHNECEDISAEDYKFFTSSKAARQTSWSCRTCCIAVKDMREDLTKVQLDQKKLKTDVKLLKTEAEGRDGKIADLTSRLEKLEQKATAGPTDVINEIEERSRRENQLVIFNVPQSEAADVEVKKAHDIKQFKKVCGTMLPEAEIPEIAQVFRFGKDKDKDRPMKVRFRDPGAADQLLAQWKEVPLKVRKAKSKMVIVKDRTPAERSHMAKQQEECNRRQNELQDKGEKDATWVVTRQGRLRKITRMEEEG